MLEIVTFKAELSAAFYNAILASGDHQLIHNLELDDELGFG